MKTLGPKDHAETVALFRAQIVGELVHRELDHGELRAELIALSGQRYRAPGADHTSKYSVSTLERWLYALKGGGVQALRPKPRGDRGRCRKLTPQQRALLREIRIEHPAASAALIVRTLEVDGRLDQGAVSETTVRRFFKQEGLDKIALRDGSAPRVRLRWQAERPNALWHSDVCHGPALVIGEQKKPLRIHAILDDASRYIIALEAHHTEREEDMLGMLVRAVRKQGRPDAWYLDNGGTYRGDILRTACGRMGVTLLHARPYDPQARGKMERFWRTLRQGCLDFTGQLSTLHDVNVRLWAWLDQHYHRTPHASLMGRAPETVYMSTERAPDAFDEAGLRAALTVRVRRRVRRDSTLPLDGEDWELDQGFLAGQLVVVARCLVEHDEPPWVEHDGKRLPLHLVDAVRNASRKRGPARVTSEPKLPGKVEFDPPKALLDKAVGRKPLHTKKVSP